MTEYVGSIGGQRNSVLHDSKFISEQIHLTA